MNCAEVYPTLPNPRLPSAPCALRHNGLLDPPSCYPSPPLIILTYSVDFQYFIFIPFSPLQRSPLNWGLNIQLICYAKRKRFGCLSKFTSLPRPHLKIGAIDQAYTAATLTSSANG